jgi:16S rRNA pseudouridine516 synthase
MGMSERLDAFLAHRGFGTRSEARDIIRGSKVTVNGKICRDCGEHVEDQEIRVHGDIVVSGPTEATLILHKPIGYACSHDEREAPLVEELLKGPFENLPLETAGRLDRDTSGLLIVTTDGELIHALTNPRKKLIKRYRIEYTGKLSSHAVERCQSGFILDDDPRATLPAKLVLTETSDSGGQSHATLFLSEGRYHQVRRMVAELGGTVTALHRDKIGALSLPSDLAPGACREISPSERDQLLNPAELPAA